MATAPTGQAPLVGMMASSGEQVDAGAREASAADVRGPTATTTSAGLPGRTEPPATPGMTSAVERVVEQTAANSSVRAR